MIEPMGTTAVVTGLGLGTFALLYALHYWKNVASRRYCNSNATMTGKTVIVTGGNSGIGRVTALDLARRGARVILACRNLQKAEDAAKEIKTRTGNSEVVVRHLDLASLQSVREFAQHINDEEKRLDILINNAGVLIVKDGAVTKDNFDGVFGTNHFGHFLLTNLLLDLLRKSAPSRVVNVSSNGHMTAFRPLDFTRGGDAEKSDRGRGSSVTYPYLKDYDKSKLANILFSLELARREESTVVTSVSLHPGVVFTPIWKKMKINWSWTLLYYLMSPFVRLFALDEEAGAQTTLHCALDPSVSDLSGQYFANCAVTQPSALAQDDGLARKLWDVSCRATGIDES